MTEEEKNLVERLNAYASSFGDDRTMYASHPAVLATEAAAAISRLVEERDEALNAENQAKDSFWAVYPLYVQTVGHGITEEAAHTELSRRATAAEASLAEAKEALKPFASHAERYEPYEGDGHHQAWQSVFTIGDVRRARRSLGEQE